MIRFPIPKGNHLIENMIRHRVQQFLNLLPLVGVIVLQNTQNLISGGGDCSGRLTTAQLLLYEAKHGLIGNPSLKTEPLNGTYLERIGQSSDDGKNNHPEQESCPFSWARSPENLLQQETYLALATAFVLLRLLYFLLPTLSACTRLVWRLYIPNMKLKSLWEHPPAYLNRAIQLFNSLKEPCKRSNLQEGAMNAKAWASKSLASVSFGDANTSRVVPMVFNNNELSGKIPSTLGLLQTLEIFLPRSHLRQVHNEFHENAFQMAGISVVGRNYYGVFPLRGTLLNVREASHKQIMKNAEIMSIKQILGLQHGKQYDSVKTLRYGHLMIMTDQLKIFEGLAFPPLYFYNGGVREFLATIKQHVLLRGKIVQNVLRARESGKRVLTAPFRLLKSNRLGVILTFAIYKTDLHSNATSSERIQATDGYLGRVFDIESNVEKLLQQLASKQTILVNVYDTTNFSHPISMYGLNVSNDRLQHVSTLNFGDPFRKHEMRCRFKQKPPCPWFAMMISIGILVIALLLGHIINATVNRIAKVEDDYHEMMELKKRAEAADVAKSQFLATVSHEIRTPMNGVLGMLQMLMDTDLDVTQQDYVKTAQGSGRALVSLINELLDQAKIESGL
ncbi:unnamed protein product [Camellia sinensis]